MDEVLTTGFNSGLYCILIIPALLVSRLNLIIPYSLKNWRQVSGMCVWETWLDMLQRWLFGQSLYPRWQRWRFLFQQPESSRFTFFNSYVQPMDLFRPCWEFSRRCCLCCVFLLHLVQLVLLRYKIGVIGKLQRSPFAHLRHYLVLQIMNSLLANIWRQLHISFMRQACSHIDCCCRTSGNLPFWCAVVQRIKIAQKLYISLHLLNFDAAVVCRIQRRSWKRICYRKLIQRIGIFIVNFLDGCFIWDVAKVGFAPEVVHLWTAEELLLGLLFDESAYFFCFGVVLGLSGGAFYILTFLWGYSVQWTVALQDFDHGLLLALLKLPLVSSFYLLSWPVLVKLPHQRLLLRLHFHLDDFPLPFVMQALLGMHNVLFVICDSLDPSLRGMLWSDLILDYLERIVF